MPVRVLSPEFRADQEATKYPFASEASLVNPDGMFIPETVFLDAAFYPIGGTHSLYISQVTIGSETVVITLSDNDTDGLATGTFELFNPPSLVKFTDAFGRPAGVLVSEPERLAAFQAWQQGTFDFDLDMTELVAAVYQPSPEIGLRGVILDDGSILTGDIWLVGDDGVVVRKEEVTTPDGITHPIIRVDVVGDPLFRRRLCVPIDLFSTPRFIKRITVQNYAGKFSCDAWGQGDFKISVSNFFIGDVALRVRPVTEGLQFEIVGTSSL